MRRAPDLLAILPEEHRKRLLREVVHGVLGSTVGAAFWSRMEPIITSKKRQPGDAPLPEDNYWQGRWRIYETD